MNIYDVQFAAMRSGNFLLADLVSRVNALYAADRLTDEDRDFLIAAAVEEYSQVREPLLRKRGKARKGGKRNGYQR